MVGDVLESLNPVISKYKKGEEDPLDSISFLQKDAKLLFNICIREYRYYYSLHCLEERVFLFFSLFLINHKDGRKTLALKKEKEKLINYLLDRFKQTPSATNGDFKQFLGELGQFFAMMTIIFIFIPLLKISLSNKIDSFKEGMSLSQKEMLLMMKKANPMFDETNLEYIFTNYVLDYSIRKSI